MNNNNIILTIRVFKGRRTYDKHGNVTSTNQTMKLSYGRLEWKLFIKNCANIFNEAEIESATEQVEAGLHAKYESMDIPKAAIIELNKAMGVEEEEAPVKKKEVDTTPNVDEELEAARKRYFEVFAKKPHHATKLETLNNKIADELSE